MVYRHHCVLVTLDVRNAFNSVPWGRIDGALRAIRVSPYLICLLRSYMENQTLLVPDGGDGFRLRPVIGGVPQGSVLEPTLWIVFYLLRLEVPDGVRPGLVRRRPHRIGGCPHG